ncbi:MAG: methylenetetrahydrofolate reductase [Planctomycetota bacterium]|nr:methylenetetrahydrofolate reductase [Planctomycetota bacterium]
MSNLRDALAAGRFAVTGEVGPPKGTNVEAVLEEAERHLKGNVLAVNVTELQTAVMRTGSLAMCRLLIECGIEPVYQVVCRDRNRLALQSDLLSAAVLGIENVLLITGDHVLMGDHPQARPVYDLDSVQLIQAAATLESGRDMVGNDLDGAPEFFKGCVAAPGAEPMEPQILKLAKKVEAGAQFVQTQAVYDPARFEQFAKAAEGIDVPVLLGIVLLKSAGMAKYMNNNVPGVQVPEAIVQRLADTPKEDRKKISAEIAGRLIRQMKPMCRGAHLMTLGWDDIVPEVLVHAEIEP